MIIADRWIPKKRTKNDPVLTQLESDLLAWADQFWPTITEIMRAKSTPEDRIRRCFGAITRRRGLIDPRWLSAIACEYPNEFHWVMCGEPPIIQQIGDLEIQIPDDGLWENWIKLMMGLPPAAAFRLSTSVNRWNEKGVTSLATP